jgi:predicted transcriptional regulator
MATSTIQLTTELKDELAAMKLHPREAYQEVLETVLEDLRELDEKTRQELRRAEAEIRHGRSVTHDQLGAKLASHAFRGHQAR